MPKASMDSDDPRRPVYDSAAVAGPVGAAAFTPPL